jgi:hypothetical protein
VSVVNPEAIGDPNQTPVVYLGEENGKALNIPQRPSRPGTEEERRREAIVAEVLAALHALEDSDYEDLVPLEFRLPLLTIVLSAVSPLIEQRKAEEIAQAIETAPGSTMWLAMAPEAAAIARSHARHPEGQDHG